MEKQILPEIKKPEALEIAIHCLGVQAEQEVCEECPAYGESGIICKEVAIVAISALKEIQQYREIGTAEEFREAVEKQKAKRPTIQKERFSSNTYNCPTCGNRLINRDIAGWYGGKRYKFCHECGQSIQWDEDLEGIEGE